MPLCLAALGHSGGLGQFGRSSTRILLNLVMAGQRQRDPAIQLSYAAALDAPTLPSAIFTPGPIVDESEIFFI